MTHDSSLSEMLRRERYDRTWGEGAWDDEPSTLQSGTAWCGTAYYDDVEEEEDIRRCELDVFDSRTEQYGVCLRRLNSKGECNSTKHVED